MILGIGVDLCQVSRIQASLDRFGPRFVQRCFCPDEARICQARPHPASAFAMRFAAKEAFSKAAGLGMRGLAWREIEVVHDKRGKPSLLLHGRAKDWAREHGMNSGHVSLSDDGDYAIAMVVLEK